jgi:aerobic C4-dicarboxylate transport protein
VRPLTITQQLGLLAVMLLTSKGAASVAGGGFIALTATLPHAGDRPHRRHYADHRH